MNPPDMNNNRTERGSGQGNSKRSRSPSKPRPPYTILEPPIQSPLDPNKYRVIKIRSNGLKAIIVSDGPTRSQSKRGRSSSGKPRGDCIDVSVEEFNRRIMNLESQCQKCGESECDHTKSSTKKKARTISDQDYKKPAGNTLASACLRVNKAGSYDNPYNLPGLAHFCEHMVCLGSKKFKHIRFDNFVEEHGGPCPNAYTRGDQTYYFFSIRQNAFEEALDMFANMFISPLIPMELILNERDIIDREFQSNYYDDYRRVYHIRTSVTAKPRHPVTSFTIGNHKTLGKERSEAVAKFLHDMVEDFISRFYQPQNMTLAVQASLPLDQLIDLVVDLFSQIPSKVSQPKPSPSLSLQFPFDTPAFRSVYKICAVQDYRWLFVSWELPRNALSNYKTKPLQYLQRIFQNDYSGGLLDYLRQCHLARYQWAETEDWNFSCIFQVGFVLTKHGVRNVFNVFKALFSYLKFIKEHGIQYWYFIESQRIQALKFHFQTLDSLDYVQLLSENLLEYPTRDVIIGSELTSKWDPAAVIECLELMKPERTNFMILAKEVEHECDKVDSTYNTKFRVDSLSPNQLESLQQVGIYTEFKLFTPNDLMPKSFCKVQPDGNDQVGKLVTQYEDSRLKIEHKMTYNFGDKSIFTLKFISPLAALTCRNSNMLNLWIGFLTWKLGATMENAADGGLSININLEYDGLTIAVDGFTEKLETLLLKVLDKMVHLRYTLTRDAFITLTKVETDDCNNNCTNVDSLCRDLIYGVLIEGHLLSHERRMQMKRVQFEQFQEFCTKILSNLYCQVKIIGNVNSVTAKRIGMSVLNILKYEPLLPGTRPKILVNQLPIGQTILRVRNMQPTSTYSKIAKYFQLGILNDRLRLFAQFIEVAMKERAYNQLRTRQGLGYTVRVYFFEIGISKIGMFAVTVETSSEAFSAAIVNGRTETFLCDFYENFVKQIPKDTFETIMNQIDRRPKNKHLIDAEEVKTLYKRFFLSKTDMRQISIQVVGNKDQDIESCKKIEFGSTMLGNGKLKNMYKKNSVIEKPDQSFDSPMVLLVPTSKSNDNNNEATFIESIVEFRDKMKQYPYKATL